MWIVLLTALGVGGATVVGALIGLLLKGLPERGNFLLTAFSAGMMLAAAVLGLILPGVASGQLRDLVLTVAGLAFGSAFLGIANHFLPQSPTSSRALLLVLAMALHNAPEGLAAGVSFGCDSQTGTFLIVSSIMLQNIPEGMIIIPPMVRAGYTPKRAFAYGFGTGMIEVLGTFLGYFAMRLSQAMLPFALGFAGGAMLFVVCGEMIPESADQKSGLYTLLAGFTLVLIADVLFQ